MVRQISDKDSICHLMWDITSENRKKKKIVNNFLRGAHKTFDSLCNLEGLVRDDSLILRSHSEGSIDDSRIYSYENALFIETLLMLGKKQEALRVYDAMMNIEVMVRDDMMIINDANDGLHIADFDISAPNNCMWLKSLYLLGKKNEAQKLYNSMTQSKNLVRPDNLISTEIDKNKKKSNPEIFGHHNCLWLDALLTLGYKQKAENTYKAMIGVEELVRPDGLLRTAVDEYGNQIDTDISSLDNSLWIQALVRLGKKDKAKKVYNSMKRLGDLITENCMVYDFVQENVGPDFSYVSLNNTQWLQALCLLGERRMAKQVYKSIMEYENYVNSDNLIVYAIEDGEDENEYMYDIYTYSNLKWIQAQLMLAEAFK